MIPDLVCAITASGLVFEVDKSRQVLMAVQGCIVELVTQGDGREPFGGPGYWSPTRCCRPTRS